VIPGVEVAAGGLVVVVTYLDVFQSVVTPRPSGGRLRISRYVQRSLWAVTRWAVLREPARRWREGILGSFGPALALVLLVIWLVLLLAGYGLISLGLATEIRPHPGPDTAFYFAGISLLTIGYGDYVPVGLAARLLAMLMGASGIGLFAVAVASLFNLYGAFRRREVEVVALEAEAGAPPSGVAMLETLARAGIVHDLPELFRRWQIWAAEMLDAHLAFPVLAYFRSSHDNDSWISSLGAVMDAATLVLTTIDCESAPMVPEVAGWARMAQFVGGHCIEDHVLSFGLPDQRAVGVELEEYRVARLRLSSAGFRLRPEQEAWEAFQELRAPYAARVAALANYWAAPPAMWISDRSPIPQRSRVYHPASPSPAPRDRVLK
jgi:hypothetical protein